MNTQEPTALETEETKEMLSGDKQPLYDLVAEQRFFDGLKPAHLQLLADSAMRMQLEPGQLVFQRGDPANRFYVILHGGVALEFVDKEGVVHRVQNLGTHDILGWSWLFPPYYWRFDAVVTEATDVLFFYGAHLRKECEKDHDLGYELMRRMSQVLIARLQTTRQKWIEEK